MNLIFNNANKPIILIGTSHGGRLAGGSDIQKDLAFGSEHSKEIIAAAQILHKNKSHHAFFFASAEYDALVQWSFSSGFGGHSKMASLRF